MRPDSNRHRNAMPPIPSLFGKQGLLDRRDRQEKRKRYRWTLLEPEVQSEVKRFGMFIAGVQVNGNDPHNFARAEHTAHRVLDEMTPKPLSLIAQIDGKAADQDCRNLPGHSALATFCKIVPNNRCVGEAVESDDALSVTDNVGARRTESFGPHRRLSQPGIEFVIARPKVVDFMVNG